MIALKTFVGYFDVSNKATDGLLKPLCLTCLYDSVQPKREEIT